MLEMGMKGEDEGSMPGSQRCVCGTSCRRLPMLVAGELLLCAEYDLQM